MRHITATSVTTILVNGRVVRGGVITVRWGVVVLRQRGVVIILLRGVTDFTCRHPILPNVFSFVTNSYSEIQDVFVHD